jgi:hypothetical protein
MVGYLKGLKSPLTFSVVSIPYTLILLSFLACFASSDPKETPRPATLRDANNLTDDCSKIHDSLSQTFFITYSVAKITAYRVRLKRFTTHEDTLEVLARPALADVTPMAIFDKDKHRGFTASLSKSQVCELYHLPTVSCTNCY